MFLRNLTNENPATLKKDELIFCIKAKGHAYKTKIKEQNI